MRDDGRPVGVPSHDAGIQWNRNQGLLDLNRFATVEKNDARMPLVPILAFRCSVHGGGIVPGVLSVEIVLASHERVEWASRKLTSIRERPDLVTVSTTQIHVPRCLRTESDAVRSTARARVRPQFTVCRPIICEHRRL